MSTGMLVAAVLAGAAWRWWDGRGDDWHPSITKHTLVRLSIVAVLAGMIGYDVVGAWGLFPAFIAVLSIHMSPAKFQSDAADWTMVGRYAIPAIVAVIPAGLGFIDGMWVAYHHGFAYVLACLIAGTSYPVLKRYAPEKIGEYGPELITGGAVIGGLAII